jgi:hypothetical protein
MPNQLDASRAISIDSPEQCRLSACCGCGKIKLQFGELAVSMKRADFLSLLDQWAVFAEQGVPEAAGGTARRQGRGAVVFDPTVLEFAAAP